MEEPSLPLSFSCYTLNDSETHLEWTKPLLGHPIKWILILLFKSWWLGYCSRPFPYGHARAAFQGIHRSDSMAVYVRWFHASPLPVFHCLQSCRSCFLRPPSWLSVWPSHRQSHLPSHPSLTLQVLGTLHLSWKSSNTPPSFSCKAQAPSIPTSLFSLELQASLLLLTMTLPSLLCSSPKWCFGTDTLLMFNCFFDSLPSPQ